MSNDEQLKREERALWERFALKGMEFVPVQKSGEIYTPEQLAERAAKLATALVQQRRDAFNELDIWADEPAQPTPERQEQNEGASDATTQHGFVEELVERLRQAGEVAYLLEDGHERGARSRVRAILTELAKMPCELPSFEQIEAELADNEADESQARWFGSVVNDLLRKNYAPILAAKDARIAELESRIPANELQNVERAQYEATIDLQKKRIEELDAKLAHQENHAYELAKQIEAHLTPVDAEGKTPGQVLIDAFDNLPQTMHARELHERGAQAVLRAFGPQMVREALERVRRRITHDDDPTGYFRKIIDDEIAKLGGTPDDWSGTKLQRITRAELEAAEREDPSA